MNKFQFFLYKNISINSINDIHKNDKSILFPSYSK